MISDTCCTSMSPESQILWIAATITAGIQLAGFSAAYLLQTEKFYDILGGINFLTLGIYSAIDGGHEAASWSEDSRKVNLLNYIFTSCS